MTDLIHAARKRVSPGIWPIALFMLAIVVAACGNGSGGGPGY